MTSEPVTQAWVTNADRWLMTTCMELQLSPNIDEKMTWLIHWRRNKGADYTPSHSITDTPSAALLQHHIESIFLEWDTCCQCVLLTNVGSGLRISYAETRSLEGFMNQCWADVAHKHTQYVESSRWFTADEWWWQDLWCVRSLQRKMKRFRVTSSATLSVVHFTSLLSKLMWEDSLSRSCDSMHSICGR